MATRREFLRSLASMSLAGAGLGGALACRRGESTMKDPAAPGGAAELIIHANLRTNEGAAQAQASAMAIAGGEILAIGEIDELEALRGAETRVLDWRDATVIPGLTDAHAHLLGLGQASEIVDLRGAGSIDEILARLREHAPREGWIIGRGWDQNLWGGEMPTHEPLDRVFPDRPVWLRRVDGHAGWANQVVLDLAGIGEGGEPGEDPQGGEILRDAKGRASGVLVDAAMDLVPVPAPTAEQIQRWLAAATKHAASLGLTGVHEMGLGPAAHGALAKLEAEARLPVRVHGYASEGWWNDGLDGLAPSPIEAARRYVLAGIKVYVDGALGSRGAALIEPYSDRPDHRGALMSQVDTFAALTVAALQRGFQVAAHAIGDLGNRTIIDAYAAALAEVGGEDHRLRIEHVQIIDPVDIPRLAELGLVASMQPTHATSDMPWAEARVGPERLAGAYAWQRILAAGVPLAFGSDFPVERPSPLLGLYAAVTRQDLEGQPAGGWLPDQRVSMSEAIAGFSSGAAYAAHREDHLGRLAPGYRADLTCLDRDPFEVEPAEIPQLKVRATMVEGQLSFEG